MQVMVQFMANGKIHILNCDKKDEMAVLVERIADIHKTDKTQVKLVFQGKEHGTGNKQTLHQTLEDLGLKDRCLVTVVTQQQGGLVREVDRRR